MTQQIYRILKRLIKNGTWNEVIFGNDLEKIKLWLEDEAKNYPPDFISVDDVKQ